MRRIWSVLVLVPLIVGTVAVDRAEARVSRRDKAAARKLKTKGKRALKKKRYNVAVRHFISAYRLHSMADTVYYIAMCHRGLVHYKRAIGALRHYLKVSHHRRHRRQRRKAKAQIKQLEFSLARLSLEIEPKGLRGGKILLDGKAVGTVPLAGAITVNPGKHVLQVKQKGFVGYKQTLEFTAGGRLTITIRLKPLVALGTLAISSPVVGALVSVRGGKPRPLPYSARLAQGSYAIRVTAPGHTPKTLTVRVEGDKSIRRRVNLEPLVRPRPRIIAAARRLTSPKDPDGRPAARSTPFYKRAWFWTVVGAVVVGAGAAAGYFIWSGSQPTDEFDLTHQFR